MTYGATLLLLDRPTFYIKLCLISENVRIKCACVLSNALSQSDYPAAQSAARDCASRYPPDDRPGTGARSQFSVSIHMSSQGAYPGVMDIRIQDDSKLGMFGHPRLRRL